MPSIAISNSGVGALTLTVFAAFYHAVLAHQVVIEDYIHAKYAKHALK